MPFASSFILTTVEGIFGAESAPVEIWRCTWKIPIAGDLPRAEADVLGYLSDIATPVATFHAANIASGEETRLVALSAASVGPDGKYLGGGLQETVRRPYAPPVAGIGNPRQPMTACCCLTLRTARARGRGSRGRLFWPALAITLGAPSMLIAAAARTTIAGEAATMFRAINTAATDAGFEGSVSVMSALGAGTTTAVNRVEVGQRMDSQERRESDIPEAYVGVDL